MVYEHDNDTTCNDLCVTTQEMRLELYVVYALHDTGLRKFIRANASLVLIL